MKMGSQYGHNMPLYFLLILALYSHQIFTNAHKAQKDLITQACEGEEDKNLCKATLQSFPESKGVDLKGLAKIALKHALPIGVEINGRISVLSKKASNKGDHRLETCSTMYQDAIQGIRWSIASLDATNDFFQVRSWLTAVLTDIRTCEDAFIEDHTKCPFSDMTSKFKDMCNIGLGVATILQENYEKGHNNDYKDLATRACDRLSKDKELCKTTIESLQENKETDPKSLSKIVLNVTLTNIIKMDGYVRLLLKKTLNRGILTSLKECSKLVRSATNDIEKSIYAVDHVFVTMSIADAMANLHTCMEGYGQERESPLSDIERKIQLLANIALALNDVSANPN